MTATVETGSHTVSCDRFTAWQVLLRTLVDIVNPGIEGVEGRCVPSRPRGYFIRSACVQR